MSKKDFEAKLIEKVGDTSVADNVEQTDREQRPSVFHPCKCANCGEYALDLMDSGVFTRAPVLGITSDGEIGCDHTELDGDYELAIYCRNCGYEICTDHSLADKCKDVFLSQRSESNSEARTVLPFDCPICHSRELCKVEVAIEFSNEVVAVCESDALGNEPLVAVSHFRAICGRGSYRYRCSNGHELAKDDGTPVETSEELVAWLKARSAIHEA